MANVTAITLVKQMQYRDNLAEEWSNKYYLTGTAPTTDADWKTLADALIAQEKTCYLTESKVVRAYGYDQAETDTSPVSVWSYDYLAAGAAVHGTASMTGGQNVPGDAAACVSWRTTRRNTKGKPIFLRKYFHSCPVFASDPPDTLLTSYVTALGNFATALATTGLLGGTVFLRSRLHAETFDGHEVPLYVTTRTLHRRGKRP